MDALPNWHYLTKHFESRNCSNKRDQHIVMHKEDHVPVIVGSLTHNIKHLEAVNIACSITYANNFKMTE